MKNLFIKETENRLFSLILVLFMILCMISTMYITSFAETKSGTGWEFDTETGELTINGNLSKAYPWTNNKVVELNSIKSVIATENAKFPANSNSMFWNCKQLKSANLNKLDTSAITDMGSMFYNCDSLEELNLSDWNTSKVIYMSNTFYNCSALKELDLSNWDVSKNTTLYCCFSNCSALEKINFCGWNTESVTSMRYMFTSCTSLKALDLSDFDTTKVTDMENMFAGCTALTRISLPANFYKGSNPTGLFMINSTWYGSDNKEYTSDSDLVSNKAVTLYSAPHNHNFTYSVDGSELFATCTVDGCFLTDSKVSLTLTANDTNYNGSANEASINDTTDWKSVNLTVPKILYIGRDGTTYAESETAPTAAGSYTAKITMDTATATKDFAINKLSQSLSFSDDNIVKTYGDNAFTVNVTGANTTIIYTSSNTDVATINAQTGEVTILKAGTTTITATASESDAYEQGNTSYTLTVNKATNEITNITIDNWQAGKTPSEPSITATFGNATFVYASALDNQFTMNEQPTKPGDYIVKAIIAESDNYEAVEKTATFTIFEAEKKPIAAIILLSVVATVVVMYVAGYFFLYKNGKLDGKKIVKIYSFLNHRA